MTGLDVLALGNLGMPELLIILLVVLILFGGAKLPGLARAIGRSLGEFKKGREEGEKNINPDPAAKETKQVDGKTADSDKK